MIENQSESCIFLVFQKLNINIYYTIIHNKIICNIVLFASRIWWIVFKIYFGTHDIFRKIHNGQPEKLSDI